VFCEKPVAADVPGTLGVLERVADRDVPVQVGFQRRFDDGFATARAAVAAGRLGWLHTIRAGTLDPAPPSMGYIAASGGLLRDCAVHDFDAIRWVTGSEVAEVYAVGGDRGAESFAEVGDVSTASVLLTLADGTFAHVAATRYNAAGYDVRLELLGSAASLSVGLDNRSPLRSAEPGVTYPAGVPHRHFLDRFAAAYERELAAFVEVVAGRAEVACSVRDALEAFYVAEASELSLRERRPVRVDEVRK
jgi:myo-inositol 2-dehydrogenase/D-chiro-inositol 1-dehydrogenase